MNGGERCVVGLTLARTADGRLHSDGAACAIVGEHVVAIAEERVSRVKHAGGSRLALPTVLAEVGVDLSAVELYCLSTCGEATPAAGWAGPLGADDPVTLLDLGVDPSRIAWVPSHHHSHAVAARTSGADLIMVVDEAGTAEADGTERASVFTVDEAGGLTLVVSRRGPPGVGALYRAVGDHLGLDGAHDGGRLMALAAYGADLGPAPYRLAEDGVSRAPDAATVAALLDAAGLDGTPARRGGTCFTLDHLVLAAEAQREVVASVLALLAEAEAVAGPWHHVTLTGGVALNCVMAGAIVRRFPERSVTIAPAPGDTGQALGNALWALSLLGVEPPPDAAGLFLGPARDGAPDTDLVAALAPEWVVDETKDPIGVVADSLAAGGLVGIFSGRSELGPRALGGRSILADPRAPGVRERLNRLKGREWFRPFGIAVLDEHVSAIVGCDVRSPAMMVALPVTPWAIDAMAGVVHVDGTVRIQSVGDECPLAPVLRRFWTATGCPALVNTSWNGAGQPMVETEGDALVSLRHLGLDHVLLNGRILTRL